MFLSAGAEAQSGGFAFARRCAAVAIASLRSWDRKIFPVAHWKWVGSGGILFRRVLQQDGVTYVGEFSVDPTYAERFCGTFGKQYRAGAVPVKGGFFYPVVSEALHFEEMVRVGCPEWEALRNAREAIICDMERARSYGKTWFAYRMVVLVEQAQAKV